MPDAPLPTLFMLPFLAATGHQWAGVASRLTGQARCVTIDLPGFGDSHAQEGFSVAAMAEAVAAVVREHAPTAWALAGHSMGAKVSCAVARMAEDGTPASPGWSGSSWWRARRPAPSRWTRATAPTCWDGSPATPRRAARRRAIM